MRSLPRAARIYAVGIYSLGLLVGLLALRLRGPAAVFEHWELVVFLVLSVLAGSRKVQLIRGTAYDRVGSMSLGFVITFAAILRFGPSDRRSRRRHQLLLRMPPSQAPAALPARL